MKKIIFIALLLFIYTNAYSAQVEIVQGDTRAEAWAKETLNNAEKAFVTGTAKITTTADVQASKAIVTEQATPSTPASGFGAIYAKTDGNLYFLNDAGSEILISGASGTPEGTAILSTGETGGVKYLREDGDGTCSWQTPAGSGDVVGPASAVDSNLVGFNTTTGKLIKDALIAIANVFTLSGTQTVTGDKTFTGDVDLRTSTSIHMGPSNYTAAAGVTTDGALRYITSPTGLAGNVFGSGNGSTQEYFLQYGTLPTADGQFLVYDETTALWVPKVLSGDATMIETGAVTVPSKFVSYAVADLSDATTPSVLTTAETTNKAISNYKASGADHVFTLPAAHVDGNIIFVIGDEFQIDIEPDTGANFYLNGTAMAANEHIQNTSDTLGEQIVGYVANINGTLTWMFESKYTNFVEETP